MSATRSRALDNLAIALFVLAAFDLLIGALTTRAIVAVVTSTEPGRDNGLATLSQINAFGWLASAAAVTALAAMCLRGAIDDINRKLWLAAVILGGLVSCQALASLYTQIAGGDDPLLWRLYNKKWFAIGSKLVAAGSIAAILVAASRIARTRDTAALAVGGLVALLVSIVGVYLLPDTMDGASRLWADYLVGSASFAVAVAAAGFSCRAAAAARRSSTGGAIPVDLLPGAAAWSSSADGLRLYGTALVWRLVITFGGYALLLMAVLGKSMGLAKLLMWALPLGAIATGVMMFAGIVRFSGQPEGSPGRAAAVFAAAAMGMALLLDFYALTKILGVVGGEPSDYAAYERSRESMEAAQKVGPWAMALGFAALGALLVSFGAIASRLAESKLVRRVVTISIWLFFIGASVVGLRLWATDLRRSEAGTAIMFAVLVGIAALVVLIAYIGLVRDVEARLRDHAKGADVPSARVVDG
jgi:hypothetical protein